VNVRLKVLLVGTPASPSFITKYSRRPQTFAVLGAFCIRFMPILFERRAYL
jgi:hypothetical protein